MDKRQTRAFEGFAAESGPELLRIAMVLTSDPHTAEDVYQETLQRLAARWPRVDNPKAFCRRVMYNIVVDQIRARARRPRELRLHDEGERSDPRAADRHDSVELWPTLRTALDSLTVQQQEQVNASTVGGTDQTSTGDTGTGQTGTTPVSYTGPTTTQADKAVAYAYAQIGKPYQWGATGPDSFDCSGLVMAAWASAGVDIPRDTYEQWAGLPHIPVSQMVPGDLIIYDGEGHVAMYVGDGYIIDAPHTGADVERIPYDTSWYVDNEDGVLQP